jgi:hypothetical protein
MSVLEPALEKAWIAPRSPIAVTVRIATTLRRMSSLLWEVPPFAFRPMIAGASGSKGAIK